MRKLLFFLLLISCSKEPPPVKLKASGEGVFQVSFYHSGMDAGYCNKYTFTDTWDTLLNLNSGDSVVLSGYATENSLHIAIDNVKLDVNPLNYGEIKYFVK